MSRAIVVALFSLLMFGCTAVHHGNFANLDGSLHQKIANDVVSELLKIAPPAKTRFVITQPVKDDFGVRFVNTLRKHGYGISREKSTSTISLHYILDMPMKNLYRITTDIGEQKMTRGYRTVNGVLEPATVWIRKE